MPPPKNPTADNKKTKDHDICQVKLSKNTQLEGQFDFLKIIWNKKRKLVGGYNTQASKQDKFCVILQIKGQPYQVPLFRNP